MRELFRYFSGSSGASNRSSATKIEKIFNGELFLSGNANISVASKWV
jgi:hypothetical protein